MKPKTAKKATTTKFRLGEILATLSTDQRKASIDKMTRAGVSYDTISRIRRTKSDEKYSPSIDTLSVIADVLDVGVEKLLTKYKA